MQRSLLQMKKKFDKDYYRNIAGNIREELQLQGIKQGTIARYLHVSEAIFSCKMNAILMFTVQEVEKIATYLNVSVEDLLEKR